MQKTDRAARVSDLVWTEEMSEDRSRESAGFAEIVVFSLAGLALTLVLIANNLFPALPLTFAQ
jgi:hypothetical protein